MGRWFVEEGSGCTIMTLVVAEDRQVVMRGTAKSEPGKYLGLWSGELGTRDLSDDAISLVSI